MTSRRVAAHGTWRSPITPQMVAGRSIRLGSPQIDRGCFYWLESLPAERGRTALMRHSPDTRRTRALTPPPWSVRTRVHEYGGGACVVRDRTAYFSSGADDRLYGLVGEGPPQPLTPPGPWRYADLAVDTARRRLLAVVEDHADGTAEPANSVCAVDLDGPARVPLPLIRGADFYSNPRLSPGGERVCWLQWAHPNMPWDGTELWVASWRGDGSLHERTLVAGGPAESVFQPEWSPRGDLHFVSDRTGHWNLYRWDGRCHALHPCRAEFGVPQWVFGMSCYGFLADGRVLAAHSDRGRWQLAIAGGQGRFEPVETPYTQIEELVTDGTRAVFRASSPGASPALVWLDLRTRQLGVLRRTVPLQRGLGRYYSLPSPVTIPSDGGRDVHGFLYAPRSPRFEAPPGERPPMIIRLHGGPTAAAGDGLSLTVQFWTTRGFAVLDLNYSGSAGYGRAYRDRLRGLWGVAEVADAVSAARHCAKRGYARQGAVVVKGSSAGGFSALCCLAFSDTFAAGASYYGIGDLSVLATGTHKFESRYHATLVGPWPAKADRYRKRSPLASSHRINVPVLLFHGAADTVVPVDQTERMFEALRSQGVDAEYRRFEREAHGFRDSATIRETLERELAFYLRVLAIDAREP